MDQETTIQSLKKQLLIERIAFAAIALMLVISWTIGHFRDAKSLILVDGKPVVCVPTSRDANDILTSIKSRTGCNPSEISFKQDVRVERAPGNAFAVSRHKAFRTVLGVVSPVVPKWAIIVNGKPAVAVPSREVAGAVLESAKLRFGKQVQNLAEEPQFKENVTVEIAAVDPAIYKKTAAEAVESLFSASSEVSKDSVHVVQKGELAGAIASGCGLKLAELWAMNPGVNLNHLQIGDRLRVKTTSAQAKLTVIVRDMSERTEAVAAPVQKVSSASMFEGKTCLLSPGSAGQRKVTVESIYQNGHLTGSETVDERVLRAPVPKRIAVGMKHRR
jgi:uncharacterized protein YabE (DUF348 family)